MSSITVMITMVTYINRIMLWLPTCSMSVDSGAEPET
ncbi:Uncharacterised protein [Mycobacteroides abscessus subsp. abscessus]|nr:Uncharacterised protein [Mycobacteroides abscessus subsp. abscessus]SKS73290.1 Uncharacterised protein [Mycobacteroides abscessus subsp. abscessus]